MLSPANPSGKRGKLILGANPSFELARQIRREGLPIGELFSFISGLYFRGKIAYARAFQQAPPGVPGVFVITSCLGLVCPERVITAAELRAMQGVSIDPLDDRYRIPLRRDILKISNMAGEGCEFVLLGSIATPKYVDPLRAILGNRLVFPEEFIGRGDMSRGGLMLRRAQSGLPLRYISAETAVRHGRRPPRRPSREYQMK